MNYCTYEKISNILWWIIGLCAFTMFVCFNYTVVIAICLITAVACRIIDHQIFKKVGKDRDSQKRRHP